MRRVIALILSIAMVASLATCLAVTSFAEEDPIQFIDESSKICFEIESSEPNIAKAMWYEGESNTVTIPAMVTYDGVDYAVTSIDNLAFQYCTFETINIPSSVIDIQNNPFAFCENLINININKENTKYTFTDGVLYSKEGETLKELICYLNSNSGTSFAIPDGVTTISDYAFTYCGGLTSIVFPDSVASIGNNAFEGCSNLQSVTLNEGIITIGNLSFNGCESLQRITITNSVTSIGDYAFCNCINLTDFTIPNSVKSIGDYAFFMCQSIESITIPSSVEVIGNQAFAGCTFETINIPSSVIDIQSNPFMSCNNLNKINVDEGNTKYTFTDGVLYSKEGETLKELVCYLKSNSGKSFMIPDGITTISDYAFYYCGRLTSVVFPDSVKSIGNNAFDGCSNLQSVTLKEGIISIGNSAFYNCKKLEDFTIPSSVKSIGDSAFGICKMLTNITIPNNVTIIGNNTFVQCSSLTNIIFPEGLTSIGQSAFEKCSSLTNIIFPGGLTSIGLSAFKNCSDLTSIVIPNSVKSIGNNAFQYCTGLTSIIIPNSVETIGNYAFNGCSGLINITVNRDVPPTLRGNDVFTNCPSLTIYVPLGSVNTYKTSWSKYANKITSPISINGVDIENCITSYGGEVIATDDNSVTVDKINTDTNVDIYIPTGKTLVVSNSDTTKNTKAAIGFVNYNDVTNVSITGGGTLIIKSAKTGIFTSNISISECIVSATCNDSCIVTHNGSITINKANVSVKPSGGESTGICSEGSITITDSTVLVEAIESVGICASEDITINGCTVEATGYFFAIKAGNEGQKDLTINNSIITATSMDEEANATIYANNIAIEEDSIVTVATKALNVIMSNNNITITDSMVIAENSSNNIMSDGINSYGSIYISSNKPVKAKGGMAAITAANGIFVGNEPITEANIVNGELYTDPIYAIVSTGDDDGFVTIITPAGPVELILNGTEVTISGTDTFKYQTDTNTAEQTSDGNTLTLEKGNYYIIKAGSETFYINYVIKNIEISVDKDTIQGYIETSENVLNAVSPTNNNLEVIGNSVDNKLYVPQAAYVKFTSDIETAREAHDKSNPTQFELDKALIDLRKAETEFVKAIRVNNLYSTDNTTITCTNAEIKFGDKNVITSQVIGTKIAEVTGERAVTTISIDGISSTYYSYIAESDIEKYVAADEANKPIPGGTTGGGATGGKYDGMPLELSTSSDKITFTKDDNNFTIKGIYYGLGTKDTVSETDYFGVNLGSDSVYALGNGTHTFRILAISKNGDVNEYYETIEVTGIDTQVVVKQCGVVYINFNGKTTSEIKYTKGLDTVYIPVEDKIKLDAAKFDGVTEITFDTTPVEIK